MKTSNKLPLERQEKIAGGLKTLRESKNLTQAEVANMVGVTVKTYREWEIGKYAKDNSTHYYPSIDAGNLLSLSELYGVSVDYLLCKSKFISPENDFIGKTTGLNDASIETLKFMNNYWNPEVMDALNYIMQNRQIFTDLIEWISVYIDNHYDTPITYNRNEHIYEPCGYTAANGKKGINFGQEVLDNKGTPGYKSIGVGVDILESHAMLKIQEILINWKNAKKDGD